MPTALKKPLELISADADLIAGDGNAYRFSLAQLEASAAAFNSKSLKAPFVPGHPIDDKPELGQATQLGVLNRKLVALDWADVDPTFAAIVNSGELNALSIKVRLPGHPENRVGDALDLVHIGFLGRSQPADGSLAEARFSQAEAHTAEFYLVHTNQSPMQTTSTPAPAPAPATPVASEAEFHQRMNALHTQEAEFKQQQAEFAAKQAEFRRVELGQRFEDLIAKGAITPAQKPALLELAARLDGDSQVITFASEGQVTNVAPLEVLFSFLGQLKQVTFGEFGKEEMPPKSAADPLQAVRDSYEKPWRA